MKTSLVIGPRWLTRVRVMRGLRANLPPTQHQITPGVIVALIL